MTNRISTKRALLTSFMALLLCFTMLLGTTYAWFTDSVTSAGNKIQAGSLKIDLELFNGTEYVSIKESKAPIFDYDLWEPGYVDVKLLKVENEGTLALKWMARFVSATELSKLADVIDVYVLPSATKLSMPADRSLAGYTRVGTVAQFVETIETTTVGTLNPSTVTDGSNVAYLGIALKMQESAGNEYQGLSLDAFDIQILATQLTYEEDSFNDQYDAMADFAYASASATLAAGEAGIDLPLLGKTGVKMGAANVPKAALAGNDVEVKVAETATNQNVTIAAGEKATTLDVTVLGLREGNTDPIRIEWAIEKGLDPATVEVYHYATGISSTYNPTSGLVTFESASFSPFTIVRDAESVYVAPEAPAPEEGEEVPANLPQANVEIYDLANTPGYSADPEVVWGSYGQWSPTEGLDSKLEAAYVFSCQETLAEAEASAYAEWECDFYVKLDRDLAKNQIFLGGNYGSFGWVGFHNGDVTLAANEEIPLLGSVAGSPWTYADVVQSVGTFICGVGDVNDALADATFTVMLRLTNPDNAEEFYDVATINHTFTKTVNSADELQDAINNGNQNIELGGDIDLGQGGIVIPGN